MLLSVLLSHQIKNAQESDCESTLSRQSYGKRLVKEEHEHVNRILYHSILLSSIVLSKESSLYSIPSVALIKVLLFTLF